MNQDRNQIPALLSNGHFFAIQAGHLRAALESNHWFAWTVALCAAVLLEWHIVQLLAALDSVLRAMAEALPTIHITLLYHGSSIVIHLV